jgi:hypothetical protein
MTKKNAGGRSPPQSLAGVECPLGAGRALAASDHFERDLGET